MGSQNEDIALMDECIDAGKTMYNLLKDETIRSIYSKYTLNEKQIGLICQMEDAVIDRLTYNNLEEYLKLVDLNTETLQKYRKRNFRGEVSLVDYAKEMMRDVKVEMEPVLKNKADLDAVSSNIGDIKEDYIKFVHSEKFAEIQKKRVASLKQDIENTEDETVRKDLREKLEHFENLRYRRFLVRRLEEYGDKEVSRLKNQFFSNRLGDYTMKRFIGAAKKFKLASNIHTYFLNLEEQFLPEEYHPLNNMFLFVAMNFVCYADSNVQKERECVDKLFNDLILLIQHKFYSESDEKEFLDLMKEVDDYFLPYAETYKKENITWKEHPTRILAGERVERRKRDEILKRLKLRGVEADPSLDSVTLQTMLDDEIKRSFEAKKEEIEEETNEETSEEKTEEPMEETLGRGNTTPYIFDAELGQISPPVEIPERMKINLEDLGLEMDPESVVTVGEPTTTPILINPVTSD